MAVAPSHMTAVFWVLLPVLISVGSALLAVWIWQRRLELQLARERQALSEARTTIEGQRETFEELDRLRTEAVQRQSLDDFLADLRTEQRRFFRDQKILFTSRKTLVVQERLFFRNIPLCNWVEHEVPVEEGVNVEEVAKNLSVFSPELLKTPSAQPKNGAGNGNGKPKRLEATPADLVK
jgi:hypothetical protein